MKARNRNLLALVDAGDPQRLRIRRVESERTKLKRRSRRKTQERKEVALES